MASRMDAEDQDTRKNVETLRIEFDHAFEEIKRLLRHLEGRLMALEAHVGIQTDLEFKTDSLKRSEKR